MEAQITFARIAMNQKNGSLKLDAVLCYSNTADYRQICLFVCLKKW